MTRLIEEWIADMEEGCRLRNHALREMTGMGLLELAATAAGVSPEGLASAVRETQAAAVPVTAGLGVIGGFARSVAAIVNAAGGNCFTTEASDVEGIHEALARGARLLFLADDNRFLALDAQTGASGENNLATAAGYAAALEGMARIRGRSLGRGNTLVLGMGPVGQAAFRILEEKGYAPCAMDKDPAKGFPFRPENIKDYPYVLEATPEGAWLTSDLLHPDALIAALGIPLALDPETAARWQGRLVHDMLDIGTAVMLAQALAPGIRTPKEGNREEKEGNAHE